ncbi:hypothetical protein DVS77_31835 [Mycolicibacterium moriokaense]|nr:hypothetical protein DVS77_31835 [Mycolicibacterium moriokaense]
MALLDDHDAVAEYVANIAGWKGEVMSTDGSDRGRCSRNAQIQVGPRSVTVVCSPAFTYGST